MPSADFLDNQSRGLIKKHGEKNPKAIIEEAVKIGCVYHLLPLVKKEHPTLVESFHVAIDQIDFKWVGRREPDFLHTALAG